MKITIVGAHGQLGKAVSGRLEPVADVVALSREALDITDPAMVRSVLDDINPDVIINCAAYTAVDAAEDDRDLAHRINADGPGLLALAAAERKSRLIHISTDFVFAGDASRPYPEDAQTQPLSVYGETKLSGERAVLEGAPGRALIIRTSWVYSDAGKNFLKTMLGLFARMAEVRVIADQVGTPTSTYSLAHAIDLVVNREDISGVYHWADAGVASWYDFAVAIAEEAHAIGLLESLPIVVPITTEQYSTPATRPAYSVLNCQKARNTLGRIPDHWRESLRQVLQRMVQI